MEMILYINAVLLMGFVVCLPSFATATSRQVYEFPEGEDASVFFYHATSSNEATYSYDLFAPDKDCVFCIDGIMDTACLDPGQRNRVVAHFIRNKTSVTVSLLLQRIQRSDRGFYLLALRETIDGHVTNLMQVAYVDARFPPGEAKCHLQSSSYTSTWKELHCTATVGNDGKGNLTCFQNSNECVFLSPVTYSATHISATFWVQMDSPVHCCSFATDTSMTPESCRQYTYPPADK